MERQENGIGFVLGLLLAFLCWIGGVVITLHVPPLPLDVFPLVRDLGGHRIITSILIGALLGVGCFAIFMRFANSTCVGICLSLGYVVGGVLGIAVGLTAAWGAGYLSGLDARPLMLALAFSGFGLGCGVLSCAAVANWDDVKTNCQLSLSLNVGILIGWLVGAPMGGDWPFVFIALGVAASLLVGMRGKHLL